MFRLVIIISLVASSLAASLPDRSGRIIGGTTAIPGQFPYMASMRTASVGHFCGGSILNRRFVMCAAHCTVHFTPSEVFTVVGAHNRFIGGTSIPTDRIINHPDWTETPVSNDISLVRTASDIVENDFVKFISLGSDFVDAGPIAIVTGWGRISDPGQMAEFLQWLSVEVITNEECRARISPSAAARIHDDIICVVSPPGQGTCGNDSGGPLALNGRVIGALSFGGFHPCGTAAPSGYARTSYYHDWLLSQIDV